MGVTESVLPQELIYACAYGQELAACFYCAANARSGSEHGTPPLLLVDVHGGAWYRGQISDGEFYAQVLARLGIAVLSIDIRDAALDGEHPSAVQDIVAALHYARAHASHFGVAPEHIGLIGSSSGGHLALLAGVQPGVPAHQGTEINLALPGEPAEFSQVTADASTRVLGIAALWPVSDPLYRYHYAKRTQRPELLAGHDAYFKTETAMRAASVPRIVNEGHAEQLPPLFVVQPGEDKNVPREMTHSLVEAWEQRGGRVSCGYYPGMPHGFACRAGGYSEACIMEVAAFFAGAV